MADREARPCIICGEPVEGWKRRGATLCQACADGKRPRDCLKCGQSFRGRSAQYCLKCRKDQRRERALNGTERNQKQAHLSGPLPVEEVLNNPIIDGPGILSPKTVFSLRLRLVASQAQLGEMLGMARGRPYTRSYISRLERGDFPVSGSVAEAIRSLDQNTRHLRVLDVRVYTLEELPQGTVILGRPRVCAGCHGWFIFPTWNQKYCSHECRLAARRARRVAR